MDCLVVMPSGDRGGQQLVTAMPPCVVGSPLLRSSMFLPRLHSIPEAAEPSTAVDDSATSGVASAIGADKASSAQLSSSAGAACSDQPAAEVHADTASNAPGWSSSTEEEPDADVPDQQLGNQQELSPAVVASTWAISMRHFTDCIPITAETVCSTSTCHSLKCCGDSVATGSPRGHRVAYSSSSQQQHNSQSVSKPGQQQCQAASSCSVPHSSSSNSLVPAAADDGDCCSSGSALLAALNVQEVDGTEWQPWDRVAQWLEAHEGQTCTAAAAAAPAAVRGQQGSSSTSPGTLQGPGTPPQQQQHQQRQHQQQEVGEAAAGTEEGLFDAPDWWQQSVKARLEEQREAFHSSWWCRLKILTGLAAQRAACSLQV